jgi:hypothetical protein
LPENRDTTRLLLIGENIVGQLSAMIVQHGGLGRLLCMWTNPACRLIGEQGCSSCQSSQALHDKGIAYVSFTDFQRVHCSKFDACMLKITKERFGSCFRYMVTRSQPGCSFGHRAGEWACTLQCLVPR